MWALLPTINILINLILINILLEILRATTISLAKANFCTEKIARHAVKICEQFFIRFAWVFANCLLSMSEITNEYKI